MRWTDPPAYTRWLFSNPKGEWVWLLGEASPWRLAVPYSGDRGSGGVIALGWTANDGGSSDSGDSPVEGRCRAARSPSLSCSPLPRQLIVRASRDSALAATPGPLERDADDLQAARQAARARSRGSRRRWRRGRPSRVPSRSGGVSASATAGSSVRSVCAHARPRAPGRRARPRAGTRCRSRCGAARRGGSSSSPRRSPAAAPPLQVAVMKLNAVSPSVPSMTMW